MGKRKKLMKKDTTTKMDIPAPEVAGPPEERDSARTVQVIYGAVRSNFYLQILIILTIIGIFLRFYQLDFNSLWLDEAFTYYASDKSLLEIWETTRTGDFHPPLFHWIEHFMLYFGNNEFILRFIPAVLGSITIPLFYLLGKEVMDERVGVISAALLTFAPFHIYYSQEAYSYSMVLFIFSLVLIFYHRAIRADSRKDWIVVGILSAIGFWVHYYTLIPLVVLFFHAFLVKIPEFQRDRKAWKNPLISGIIFTACIAPLVFIVIERYLTLTAEPPTYGVFGIALVTETFLRFSSFQAWIAIVFLILFIIGLIPLFQHRRSTCLLFILMMTVPLVISVLVSSTMTMNPRYLIYLMAPFYTGIACSYCLLQKVYPKKWIILLIIVGIALLNAPSLSGYYQSAIKDDWRTYAGVLGSNTRDGDMIVLIPRYIEMPFGYYYDNVSDHTTVYGAVTPGDIEQILLHRQNNTIYYVVTNDITAANPEGDTINWLSGNTQFLGQYMSIYTFTS